MKSTFTNLVAFSVVVALMLVGSLPLYAMENDDAIVESFKESYVCKTYLKDDDVKVHAQDGVVTLTGTVAGEEHKALAEDTAKNLPGVTRVDNQLAIRVEDDSEYSDTWLSLKVKSALLFYSSVSYTGTTVDVRDGVVTLRGEASSQAQKELTERYAADIEGVKSVNNLMTVAATMQPVDRTTGEKIDDASITAQVKAALSTQSSTSHSDVMVVSRDGEVTLTGIAKNEAEKDLITDLVGDVRGVTDVENKMTVQEN